MERAFGFDLRLLKMKSGKKSLHKLYLYIFKEVKSKNNFNEIVNRLRFTSATHYSRMKYHSVCQ